QERCRERYHEYPFVHHPDLSLYQETQRPLVPLSERVCAMRANREEELKQGLVGSHPFRVVGVPVLATNLAELARPVGQDQRRPLDNEARAVRAIRVVVSDAAKPASSKLIVTADVHPERGDVSRRLPAR